MDRKQINEEKTKIYEEMNDLVYAGIHDIKSPIANLKLINKLLKSLNNLDEVKEYATMSTNALAQVDASIDGLAKALNLLSHNGDTIETINFSRVTRNLKGRYPDLELQEDFSNAPEISYVPEYINILLENIISNSINYKNDGNKAKLQLYTHRENGYLILRAKDNGRGLDLDRYGSKIFRFFTKVESDGAGMGLYLIKTIAEKNGGKVQIESEVGKGTTLAVFLRDCELPIG